MAGIVRVASARPSSSFLDCQKPFMTDIGSQENPPKAEAAEVAAAEAPPPEPWTPRRVTEWNSYYDLYVAGFVVLLVFLGSANKIQAINTGLWSLLNAGRQTM